MLSVSVSVSGAGAGGGGHGAGIVGQSIGYISEPVHCCWTHVGIEERSIVGVAACRIFRSKEAERLSWNSDEASTSMLLMTQSLKYAAMAEMFLRGRTGRNCLLVWKEEGKINYLRDRDRLGFGCLLKRLRSV